MQIIHYYYCKGKGLLWSFNKFFLNRSNKKRVYLYAVQETVADDHFRRWTIKNCKGKIIFFAFCSAQNKLLHPIGPCRQVT